MKKTIKRQRPYNEGVLEVLKITATKKGCKLKYHPNNIKCQQCEYSEICSKSAKERAVYKEGCDYGINYLLNIAKEMECNLHPKENSEKCCKCPHQRACFQSPNSRRKIHKDWEKRRKQEREEAKQNKKTWFDLIEAERNGMPEEDESECKEKCDAYPTMCTGYIEDCVSFYKDFEA